MILWQIQRDGVGEKVWKSRERRRFGRISFMRIPRMRFQKERVLSTCKKKVGGGGGMGRPEEWME